MSFTGRLALITGVLAVGCLSAGVASPATASDSSPVFSLEDSMQPQTAHVVSHWRTDVEPSAGAPSLATQVWRASVDTAPIAAVVASTGLVVAGGLEIRRRRVTAKAGE